MSTVKFVLLYGVEVRADVLIKEIFRKYFVEVLLRRESKGGGNSLGRTNHFSWENL